MKKNSYIKHNLRGFAFVIFVSVSVPLNACDIENDCDIYPYPEGCNTICSNQIRLKVLGYIEIAIDAIENGDDYDTVLKIIKTAMNHSKQINGSDNLNRYRHKGSAALKRTRKFLKKSNPESAIDELKKANIIFKQLDRHF